VLPKPPESRQPSIDFAQRRRVERIHGVEATMGGTTSVQTFFRFYLAPGFGHSGRLSGVGYTCQ
jgi:hypothetical protein